VDLGGVICALLSAAEIVDECKEGGEWWAVSFPISFLCCLLGLRSMRLILHGCVLAG